MYTSLITLATVAVLGLATPQDNVAFTRAINRLVPESRAFRVRQLSSNGCYPGDGVCDTYSCAPLGATCCGDGTYCPKGLVCSNRATSGCCTSCADGFGDPATADGGTATGTGTGTVIGTGSGTGNGTDPFGGDPYSGETSTGGDLGYPTATLISGVTPSISGTGNGRLSNTNTNTNTGGANTNTNPNTNTNVNSNTNTNANTNTNTNTKETVTVTASNTNTANAFASSSSNNKSQAVKATSNVAGVVVVGIAVVAAACF